MTNGTRSQQPWRRRTRRQARGRGAPHARTARVFEIGRGRAAKRREDENKTQKRVGGRVYAPTSSKLVAVVAVLLTCRRWLGLSGSDDLSFLVVDRRDRRSDRRRRRIGRRRVLVVGTYTPCDRAIDRSGSTGVHSAQRIMSVALAASNPDAEGRAHRHEWTKTGRVETGGSRSRVCHAQGFGQSRA